MHPIELPPEEVGGEMVVLLTEIGVIPKETWLGFDRSIPAIVTAVLLLVGVSYFTRPPPRERVDAYMGPEMDIFKYIK